MKKVSLSPEALAALNADNPEPLKAPPKPLSKKAVQIIRMHVAEVLFGPTLKPTLKQQLLGYSSFAAIKAGWAADHFQRKMGERYGAC
jgi:hypothetical protein